MAAYLHLCVRPHTASSEDTCRWTQGPASARVSSSSAHLPRPLAQTSSHRRFRVDMNFGGGGRCLCPCGPPGMGTRLHPPHTHTCVQARVCAALRGPRESVLIHVRGGRVLRPETKVGPSPHPPPTLPHLRSPGPGRGLKGEGEGERANSLLRLCHSSESRELGGTYRFREGSGSPRDPSRGGLCRNSSRG